LGFGFLDTVLGFALAFFEAFRFPMLGEAANDTLFFFWEFRV
jgi:hypothetical protein